MNPFLITVPFPRQQYYFSIIERSLGMALLPFPIANPRKANYNSKPSSGKKIKEWRTEDESQAFEKGFFIFVNFFTYRLISLCPIRRQVL